MTSLRNAVFAAALLCLLALTLSATARADSRYVVKGFGAGTLSGSPTQLAVDEVSGDVLVVDKPNNRVLVFSSGGSPEASLVAQFGAGELSGPYGIAVDQSNGPSTPFQMANCERLGFEPKLAVFFGFEDGRALNSTLTRSCTVRG